MRRVPHLGGACTKDLGGLPGERNAWTPYKGLALRPCHLKTESPVSAAALLLNVWIFLKNIIVPIYWWKRHHSFIRVGTTCSQVLQQVILSFGCPVSFVLMPGCSLDCCETHRDPFKSGIHSQFHMYWTFSPLDPCSKVQSKKFLPWNEVENWWFPINSTHNELLLSNRR